MLERVNKRVHRFKQTAILCCGNRTLTESRVGAVWNYKVFNKQGTNKEVEMIKKWYRWHRKIKEGKMRGRKTCPPCIPLLGYGPVPFNMGK
jgi:hypothetical protein